MIFSDTLDAKNLGPRTPGRHKDAVWAPNLSAFCQDRLRLYTPLGNMKPMNEKQKEQEKSNGITEIYTSF